MTAVRIARRTLAGRALPLIAGLLVLSFFPASPFHPEEAVAPEKDGADGTGKPGTPEMPEGLDAQAALLARLSGVFEIEDPTSVYDFDIDDNEVEFVLDGTWETRFDSFLDFTIGKKATTMSFTPPVFSQAVNLSSWVLINETWYFESSFQEEFRKNTVAAGYLGGEDDPIKHARIGNSKIIFPDAYEFIAVGGGTAIAPGAMGTFAGDDWNADAVVRYDAAASRELVLSGMNEVSDEFIPITAFARGKWFVLPEAPITGAVTVFVTDDNGPYRDASSRISGRRWRKLEQEEFAVRGTDGILELKTETSGSVAIVYYGSYALSASSPAPSLLAFIGGTRAYFDAISGAMPSGYLPDPAQAGYEDEVADRFLADIAGSTALILRERGHFSPFEILSRYRAESSAPELKYEGTLTSPDNLACDQYDETYAEVFRADASTGARDPVNRFPLAREFPLLYLPSGGGQRADTDLSLLNRNWKPVSTISLGEDAIAGTIQVTRNGISDDAFEFDDETGILTLARIPSASETVRVTWLDTDDSARNATLTVAGGARWRPTDAFSLFSASSFRWNVTKSGFTDADERSPGSFIVSVGGEYAREGTRASTAFALDVSVPDTTGLYRAEGMDSGTNAIYPDEDWYETIGAETGVSIGEPESPTPIVLAASRYAIPSGTDDGEPPTVSDPSMTGSVLALSADLSSVDQWTGATVLVGDKADVDLSAASTVSLWIRNPGETDSFETYLQLGSGNSETGEDPDTVRTWRLETPVAGSGWIRRTVTLDDSDRSALAAGGNVRVILRPNQSAIISESSPVSISIRTGGLSYTDTGFSSRVEPPFSESAGFLSVEETVDPAPVALVSSGADEPKRFNAGSANTVLVARYTPEEDTERAVMSSHLRALPLSSYDELSFFVYADTLPPEASGGVIRLTLSRPQSSGSSRKTALEVEIAAAAIQAGVWQKVTVDLGSGTVSVGGTGMPSSRARVVALDPDEAPTRVEFSLDSWLAPQTQPASGSTAYTIAFDELFLGGTDPVYTYRNRSAYSWNRKGALLSIGKTSILSDPAISVTADSSVRNDTSEARASGTAAGGIGILRARADGTVTASSETARVADSTSHSVSVPLWPITLRESYAADFAGDDFSRKDSVSLSGPLALDANASLDLNGRNLARTASFGVTPRFPVTPIGSFTLRGDSDFSQSGLSPVTDLSRVDWQDLWLDTFVYSLSTGESDATRRKGKHSVEAGWRTDRGSGVTVVGEAASSYAASSETTLGSELSFGLITPVRIGLSTLTPSWRRTAGETRAEERGGSYFSDGEFLSASATRLTYLYTVAPFSDLFEEDIADRIADSRGVHSRSLENRYGIAWARPSIGRLSDLWVPSMVDTSLSRLTETDATVAGVSDEWNASAKAGMSALNMAGAFGARRIFKWYEQDEISQLYAWNGKWGRRWFTWNVDTLHSLTLFFPEKASLVADNAFHYDSPDIAGDGKLIRDTVRFVWKRPGKKSFVSALAARWTNLPLSTAREETVTLTVTRGETDSEAASFDHVLKTGIGANGEVSVNTGLSYASGEDVTTIGFRLGIGGKLSY